MLKRLGFYREFYPGTGSSLPSIHDEVRPTGVAEESAIVEYLRAGNMIAAVMEGMADVIDGELFRGSSGCSSLLTDGVWLWRQDLAHYVERHHVPVPDDFLRFVGESGFRMPVLSDSDLVRLEGIERDGLGPDWWASA